MLEELSPEEIPRDDMVEERQEKEGDAVQEETREEDQGSGEDPSTLDEAQEQKRWTKRAQQMLHTLNRELSKKDETDFKNLSRKSTRKQAAYKFYTLLILNKEKAITICEDGLYGNISVVKGEKFDEMV